MSDELIKAAREFNEKTRHKHTSLPAIMADFHLEQSKPLMDEIERLRSALEGWMGWWNGPAQEGVSYINPPIRRTCEALAKGDTK